MAELLPASLPDAPNLEWLRKHAKQRLEELRRTDPAGRLADAQFDLAKQYGFSSWRALKREVDSLTVEAQLFEAARTGDVARLETHLDEQPEGLHVRTRPYEQTLLHVAAANGQLAAVELLLDRGLDVNDREKGDNTYPCTGPLRAVTWTSSSGWPTREATSSAAGTTTPSRSSAGRRAGTAETPRIAPSRSCW
jgi:Ankyrin repeat